jgi:hypothetical protein
MYASPKEIGHFPTMVLTMTNKCNMTFHNQLITTNVDIIYILKHLKSTMKQCDENVIYHSVYILLSKCYDSGLFGRAQFHYTVCVSSRDRFLKIPMFIRNKMLDISKIKVRSRDW